MKEGTFRPKNDLYFYLIFYVSKIVSLRLIAEKGSLDADWSRASKSSSRFLSAHQCNLMLSPLYLIWDPLYSDEAFQNLLKK